MRFGEVGGQIFGRIPPAGLSKDLLGRMIAWRLQERAFGGLDRDSLASSTASRDRAARPVASSNPAPCSFANTKASATPSRSSATASTGREPPIRASRRSRAPSPARPGAAPAFSPCKSAATAAYLKRRSHGCRHRQQATLRSIGRPHVASGVSAHEVHGHNSPRPSFLDGERRP